MSQMNNNIDNKTALYAEVFGKKWKKKNIFIQFIYNKDLVYNWNVIYSLINKQFLRLKIFNNFLRDKQQYYSFFYITLVYFM